MFRIRGILFDVDGTLYSQPPVRIMTILMLFGSHLFRPKALYRKIRIILAYRKAQEKLRTDRTLNPDDAMRQLVLAADNTRESLDEVQLVVHEWFEIRPLPYLKYFRSKGIHKVLSCLDNRGFKLGIFSDYPALDKLYALGVRNYFGTVISGTDEATCGFKPWTNGFELAAAGMGLLPEDVLYVGDRPAVDGAGASKAGMQVVILTGRLNQRFPDDYLKIKSLSELLKIVELNV